MALVLCARVVGMKCVIFIASVVCERIVCPGLLCFYPRVFNK